MSTTPPPGERRPALRTVPLRDDEDTPPTRPSSEFRGPDQRDSELFELRREIRELRKHVAGVELQAVVASTMPGPETRWRTHGRLVAAWLAPIVAALLGAGGVTLVRAPDRAPQVYAELQKYAVESTADDMARSASRDRQIVWLNAAALRQQAQLDELTKLFRSEIAAKRNRPPQVSAEPLTANDPPPAPMPPKIPVLPETIEELAELPDPAGNGRSATNE